MSSVETEAFIRQLSGKRQRSANRKQRIGKPAKELEDRVKERTADLEKRRPNFKPFQMWLAQSHRCKIWMRSCLHLQNWSANIGFYHAGIFLVDDANQYSVLRALSNSEGGKRMLNRQHKLTLDTHSMVGYTTSLSMPRIALDVGADAVYFSNPDLPATRSKCRSHSAWASESSARWTCKAQKTPSRKKIPRF
ncbi:MAG: hypothetical protein U0V48_16345 [Anaerolineales bacterium]